ncbi:hypothetical protein AB0K60_25175 [Thermopolyspora sp. NPDC052614]|uniref:hypothetical protein n=1 Tax=Thermopolyspora sp. NPDC052614 TaxID=3155682 RepID=UPI00343E5B7E
MRPSPERIARLRALADLHDEFVRRNADSAPFHPEGRPAGSDYNQHHVFLEMPAAEQDEFFRRAREIMGLDPVTGHWLEPPTS